MMSLALLLQGVSVPCEVLGLKIYVSYKVFIFVIIRVEVQNQRHRVIGWHFDLFLPSEF